MQHFYPNNFQISLSFNYILALSVCKFPLELNDDYGGVRKSYPYLIVWKLWFPDELFIHFMPFSFTWFFQLKQVIFMTTPLIYLFSLEFREKKHRSHIKFTRRRQRREMKTSARWKREFFRSIWSTGKIK